MQQEILSWQHRYRQQLIALETVSGVEAVNVDAPAYTPVQGIDGMMLPTLNADLEGMAAKVESIKNTFDTLQTTVAGLKFTSLTGCTDKD